MSLLPQLERDLYQAASERLPASDYRAPAAPARRHGVGRFVVALSVAVSIAIAVFAIGTIRHGPVNHPQTGARSSTPGYGAGPGNRILMNLAPGRDVAASLVGLPQSGARLGDPHAPVTVVLFADLECPICKALVLDNDGGGFQTLVAKDVRRGRVKIVFRSFCTTTCNGPGRRVFDEQQVAAYAAGKQDLLWDYAELFYREQGQEYGVGYVTSGYLTALAQQVPGLNLKTWQTDRNDPGLLAHVQADEHAASSQKILGTPTLVITGAKGRKTISGVASYHTLERAIRHVQ